MTFEMNQNGADLVVAVNGRLDTVTSPELEAALNSRMPGAQTLTLDFAKVEYISSAGLRVLLSAQRAMSDKGGMKLIHVSPIVLEVFEVTGFSDILTIE